MSNAAILVKNLQANGINISTAGEQLKIDAPKGSLSNEAREQLRAHKTEILEYLKTLAVHDFCAVCRARLFELPSGEWSCPTDKCTEARLRRNLSKPMQSL